MAREESEVSKKKKNDNKEKQQTGKENNGWECRLV